jgi:toxin ParE1/3/4
MTSNKAKLQKLKPSSKNFGVTRKSKVKLTASAQSDIYNYITEDNPSNAVTFIAELEKQIHSLSTYSDRNPYIPESAILQTQTYRHQICKNYRIIYKIQDDIVFVLRIFHGSKLLDIAAIE